MPRGSGAGATGEGSRRVPDSSNASSDRAVTRSALKPCPHRLWRARARRAWPRAARVSGDVFLRGGFRRRACTAAPRLVREVTKNTTTNEEHTKNEERMTKKRGGGSFTSPRTPRTRSRRSSRATSSCSEASSITLRNRRARSAAVRDTLRETFFSRSARDAAARDAVAFSTLRLPLAGHVSLAKNAHLPCLAVAQTLMVFRRVHRSTEKEREKEKESRRGSTASGVSRAPRRRAASAVAKRRAARTPQCGAKPWRGVPRSGARLCASTCAGRRRTRP